MTIPDKHAPLPDTSPTGIPSRMRARFGPSVANVATAHKLARIVYAMLKTRQPYQPQSLDAYEEQYRKRTVGNLRTKAKQLGYELVAT